jgi:hypothetical protein
MKIVKFVVAVVVTDDTLRQGAVIEDLRRLIGGQPTQLPTVQWASCEMAQYRPQKTVPVQLAAD